MRYSKTAHAAGASGFFFDGDVNAPADAIEVSENDVLIAVNAPAGSTYDFDSTGKLTVTAPSASQLAAMQQAIVTAQMAEVMKAFRAGMETLINRLVSIGFSALVSGDTATAQACQTAKTNLLAIPTLTSVTGATDVASLEAALYAAYQAGVATVPANVVQQIGTDFNSFSVLGF